MSNYSDYYGIDISKLTFDVVNQDGNHIQLTNDSAGFDKLYKTIPKDCLCIMEATGVYHLQLAIYLFKKGIAVAVINPLRIKRFIQMNLKRNKTDKSDARMISLYGQTQKVEPWKPIEKVLDECKDIYVVMEQYITISTRLKNKIDSLKSKKSTHSLIKNIEKQITSLKVSIKELENELITKIKSYDSELLSNIKSIKGIGERTAMLLIISTNGFKDFKSAKQLSSFFGLAPVERTSGTSVNGARRISKIGNSLVRNKLFMCSLPASKFNKTCCDLYQRLLAKGKPKKVALIAVVNKLLKIVFAISKSGLPYDPFYKSYRAA